MNFKAWLVGNDFFGNDLLDDAQGGGWSNFFKRHLHLGMCILGIGVTIYGLAIAPNQYEYQYTQEATEIAIEEGNLPAKSAVNLIALGTSLGTDITETSPSLVRVSPSAQDRMIVRHETMPNLLQVQTIGQQTSVGPFRLSPTDIALVGLICVGLGIYIARRRRYARARR